MRLRLRIPEGSPCRTRVRWDVAVAATGRAPADSCGCVRLAGREELSWSGGPLLHARRCHLAGRAIPLGGRAIPPGGRAIPPGGWMRPSSALAAPARLFTPPPPPSLPPPLQEFIEAHPYPVDRVPSLCLASCDRGASSLLKPVIDFFALRYGEWSDGCVCQADSILPGCARVLLDDMDHFGPGWPSFPATDRYDPARLWLLATSLALTTPCTAGASAARGAKGAGGRPDGGGSSPAEADAGGREAAPRARGVAAKRRHRRHGTDTWGRAPCGEAAARGLGGGPGEEGGGADRNGGTGGLGS